MAFEGESETAFKAPNRLYQGLVIPFAYPKPRTFMPLMRAVLRLFLGSLMVVYCNDPLM